MLFRPCSLLLGWPVVDAVHVGHEDGQIGADVDPNAAGEAVVVRDVKGPGRGLSVLERECSSIFHLTLICAEKCSLYILKRSATMIQPQQNPSPPLASLH